METALAGVLVGMYAETGLAAILLYAGLSLSAAGLITGTVMIIVVAAAYWFGSRHTARFNWDGVKWFEWVSLVFIAETIVFALWQLTRMPTYLTMRFNTGPAAQGRSTEESTGPSMRNHLSSWERRLEIITIRCWP